jgi:hypothetical protein
MPRLRLSGSVVPFDNVPVQHDDQEENQKEEVAITSGEFISTSQ